MPRAEPRPQPKARGAAILTLALVAAVIVAARLPFLLYGSRFFDSDEAVEGLMARHLLTGEFPWFLWGQRYKGVPEVYLTAAAFRIWPAAAGGTAGILALKAATLACFAGYACLNFRLLAQLFSRRVAWMATAFLAAGPPSLVLWSLSGSAEIVMTWLAGTSLLLGFAAWRRSGSRAGLVVAAASLGFGLWIQQYILYYVAALGVASIDWTPEGRARMRDIAAGAGLPGWRRLAIRLVALASGVYIVLGFAAFLGFGFDMRPFGIAVTVTHPQKMWWIASALLLIAAAGAMLGSIPMAPTLAPALGFLAGYAPAMAGRFFADGPGAPTSRMDLAGLVSALPPLSSVSLPIVFGFRSPTTEPLAVPAWSALLIGAVVLISFLKMSRGAENAHPLHAFFHIFAVLTPIVFVASGSYIDAQSYRYLMPVYAALPVIYAVGIDGVLRASRVAGVLLFAALVSLFALQQADWYRRLEPDRDAQAIVGCLDRAGVRGAYADYWLSYRLTFLTSERVIVAPTNGVDRYPPYTATVRANPSAPTIQRPAAGATNPCSTLSP